MKNIKKLLTILVLIPALTACGKKSATSDDDPSTGGGAAGSTLFTATSIAKTWTTTCFAAADAITSADHYQLQLVLSAGGTFTYHHYWYTGTCSPSNYTILYNTYGTFTVGALVSGSTTMQDLTFTATSSDMMAFNTTAQTAVNNDCGGTSPYIGGVNSSFNGAHESTYMMNCSSQNFPNSGRPTIDNVATYSGTGGVLTLGAAYNSIPGVYAGGSIPATATVQYY